MTDPAIATAADYADALLTARRAKNLLVLIVLLMLLIQLAVFFVVKYTALVYPMTGNAAPTTVPASNATWHSVAQYAIGTSVFVGVAGTILTALVLYLITQIMVVGRLIGVSRVISALVWTFVVLVLLFPWQAFLRDQTLQFARMDSPRRLVFLARIAQQRYRRHAGSKRFDGSVDPALGTLRRLAIGRDHLLLSIQVKSNRGLRQALGEEVIDTADVTPPPAV